MAVENGDIGLLKSLGIKDSELGDVKFFLEKLVNTGFLDWIWNYFLTIFSLKWRKVAEKYQHETWTKSWQ